MKLKDNDVNVRSHLNSRGKWLKANLNVHRSVVDRPVNDDFVKSMTGSATIPARRRGQMLTKAVSAGCTRSTNLI